MNAKQRKVLGTVMRALGHVGGKASAASMTKQQRIARAKKAGAASVKKRLQKEFKTEELTMRRKNGSTSSFHPIIGDVTFASGYVTRYIEDYARTQEIPSALLAEGVAAILHAQGQGYQHHLPALRPPPTKRSSAVGEVEVAERSRNAVPRVRHKMSARGRRAISKAQKARWKKQKEAIREGKAA